MRFEEARRCEEWERLNPPPPPFVSPITPDDAKKFDRVNQIIPELGMRGKGDTDLLLELLSVAGELMGSTLSLPLRALRRKADHYFELNQPAAKERLWWEIYSEAQRVQTELSWLRRFRERGGSGVQ